MLGKPKAAVLYRYSGNAGLYNEDCSFPLMDSIIVYSRYSVGFKAEMRADIEGGTMYGYKIINSKAVIDEQGIRIIISIFNGYISGLSMRRLQQCRRTHAAQCRQADPDAGYLHRHRLLSAIISRRPLQKANGKRLHRANLQVPSVYAPPIHKAFELAQARFRRSERSEYIYSRRGENMKNMTVIPPKPQKGNAAAEGGSESACGWRHTVVCQQTMRNRHPATRRRSSITKNLSRQIQNGSSSGCMLMKASAQPIPKREQFNTMIEDCKEG